MRIFVLLRRILSFMEFLRFRNQTSRFYLNQLVLAHGHFGRLRGVGYPTSAAWGCRRTWLLDREHYTLDYGSIYSFNNERIRKIGHFCEFSYLLY